ncbi:GNAT family N-acetyltransferase [Aliivibrio fischeri]|uniref:GNAT family N-acetyltransferase n=1 Tax=Aliivibrio fischeri TaxID=668 RepID=UPI0007C4A218|nr:GNAT family N-acetyltransferase [Aliivibrio fischeri]
MNLTVSHLDKLRLPLLHKIYKENYPSGKPKGKEEIIVIEGDKKILGAMRIKTYEECHFLTGMMIIKERRGESLGSQLLFKLNEFLLLEHCYCFCEPQLSEFYLKNDFIHIDKKNIPHVLKSKHDRYTNTGKELDILLYKKTHN